MVSCQMNLEGVDQHLQQHNHELAKHGHHVKQPSPMICGHAGNFTAPKSNHEITEIGSEMHDVVHHAEGDTKRVGRLESEDNQRL